MTITWKHMLAVSVVSLGLGAALDRAFTSPEIVEVVRVEEKIVTRTVVKEVERAEVQTEVKETRGPVKVTTRRFRPSGQVASETVAEHSSATRETTQKVESERQSSVETDRSASKTVVSEKQVLARHNWSLGVQVPASVVIGKPPEEVRATLGYRLVGPTWLETSVSVEPTRITRLPILGIGLKVEF